MRFSPQLEQGRLLVRYKRFLADIETDGGELLTIHCPNTGSMLNCMMPGGRVWFSRSNDPKRKLPGTWEISETPQGRLACINTGRANTLVEEALRAGVISELTGFTALKREVAYGQEKVVWTFVWSTRMAICIWKLKVSLWDSMVPAWRHSPMR